MDRNRFSAIGHRGHLFSNPISDNKINTVVQLAELNPGDKAKQRVSVLTEGFR